MIIAVGGALTVFVNALIWLLFTSGPNHALWSDVDCLRAVKHSLKDPLKYLSNWNFNNNTEGFICEFTGIECWRPDENTVLQISLSGMGLGGEFPIGLENCQALAGVNLSGNKLYGIIPSSISDIVAYATSLDLSSNEFSGTIPNGLANCSYLNTFKLDDNQLTGEIPPALSFLARIKTFSVANNRLSGPVPSFNANASVSADSHANNPGLCGSPLPARKGPAKKINSRVIIGAAVGGVIIGALVWIIVIFCVFRRVSEEEGRRSL